MVKKIKAVMAEKNDFIKNSLVQMNLITGQNCGLKNELLISLVAKTIKYVASAHYATWSQVNATVFAIVIPG